MISEICEVERVRVLQIFYIPQCTVQRGLLGKKTKEVMRMMMIYFSPALLLTCREEKRGRMCGNEAVKQQSMTAIIEVKDALKPLSHTSGPSPPHCV